MTKTSILLVGLLFASSSVLALGCGDDNTGDTTSSSSSSSGDMSSSSSGSGSSSSSSSGGMSAAEKYCAAITANCTAANGQYPSEASCMAAAAAFAPGMDTDTSGNTLGCRTYHAGAAMGDPMTHCGHAGPSGDAACGNICEGFCDFATATCKTEWPDKTACMTACMAFPSEMKSYNTGFTSGNTVECRLYHLSVAATDATSAATHCPHTAAVSTQCM